MKQEMVMVTEPKKPKWKYIETPRSARIQIAPTVQLIAHWYGDADADEIRAAMKRGVVAVNNFDALVEALSQVISTAETCKAKFCWKMHGPRLTCGCQCHEIIRLSRAALANAKE